MSAPDDKGADKSADFVEALRGLPTKVWLSHASATYERREGESEGEQWERTPDRSSIVLGFSEAGFGFGEVTIVQTKAGVFIDTECMSIDRCKRYLLSLLDGAIADHDEDPTRHALFNEVMGRQCGTQCRLCHPEPPKDETR